MSLPSLAPYKHISIDIETHDPELKNFGPGSRRSNAYILGIAIAVRDMAFYIPIAHPDTENIDKEIISKYFKRYITPDKIIIGANIIYDLDWLECRGIKVPAKKFYDVLIAEHLLDEESKISLDNAAALRLNQHKVYDAINEAGQKINPKKEAILLINQMPASIVREYAIPDAVISLKLFFKQTELLEKEELTQVMDIENRLIPLMLAMRQKGVKIKTDKIVGIRNDMRLEQKELLENLPFNPNSPKQTALYLQKSGFLARPDVQVEYTDSGNISINKSWLESYADLNPVISQIKDAKTLSKLISTYLENMFDNYLIHDRLHTLFHQVSLYDGGTRSGRFSSSHPNLQNIPVRDKKYAKMIRQLFIPEEDQLWGRFDYSQIEYRMLAYYCFGPGSAKFKQEYRSNPKVDFHQMCMDLIKELTGKELDRKKTKTMNFGMVYGMGQTKLKNQLGVDNLTATQLLLAYHTAAPFIKALYNRANKIATNRGYIITLGKRRSRFKFRLEDNSLTTDTKKAANYAAEVLVSANQLRANTNTALNRLLQGSAADFLKKAMVDLWEGGLCDEIDGIGVPLLTVHDELDFSFYPRNKKVLNDVKNVMENAIKMNIPILVDFSHGRNWGEASED